MALQGAFREHQRAFEEAGARTRLVRLEEDLAGLDGLVIPGGESTTMTMLMERMGLFDPVRDAVLAGLPTLGTCAGMIILAHRVSDGIDGQRSFDALDIDVRRNGYDPGSPKPLGRRPRPTSTMPRRNWWPSTEGLPTDGPTT